MLTSGLTTNSKGNMRLTIPNQLTILRILLTPVFAFYFLQKTPSHQLLATVLFAIAAFTDWYDGWFARKFSVITRFGQFMDPLADKILVSTALIVFAALNYVFWWMVWAIIARDALITINRIYALYIGRPIITHVVAKWKTAAQMFTVFLILIFVNYRNYYQETTTPYAATYLDPIGFAMLTVTVLTVISGIIYIYENRALLVGLLRKLVGR